MPQKDSRSQFHGKPHYSCDQSYVVTIIDQMPFNIAGCQKHFSALTTQSFATSTESRLSNSTWFNSWNVLAIVAPKFKLWPLLSADIFDKIELITCSKSKSTFLAATRHPKGPIAFKHCSVVSKIQLGLQLKLQFEIITESSDFCKLPV